MIEATAQKKFACPACGAEARWDPGKKSLVCPFCGTTSPADVEVTASGEQVIKEHDLAAALRAIPDDKRGWQARKTDVRCQSCQAISVFDPERVGQRCDFCGSSALVPYQEVKDAFRPESLLAMKVSETQVRESIRRLVPEPLVCAEQAKDGGVHGYCKRTVHPLLDLRCPGACGLDRRERVLLLCHGDISRLERAHANPTGAKEHDGNGAAASSTIFLMMN